MFQCRSQVFTFGQTEFHALYKTAHIGAETKRQQIPSSLTHWAGQGTDCERKKWNEEDCGDVNFVVHVVLDRTDIAERSAGAGSAISRGCRQTHDNEIRSANPTLF